MESDNSKKNKILVVDDEPITRSMIRVILEGRGYNVVEVENGEDAVLMVMEDTKEEIISILMDINMPVLNGIEATGIIRNMIRYNSLLIIGLGGSKKDEKKALKSGMNHFIVKPATDFDLICKLIEAKKRKQIN